MGLFDTDFVCWLHRLLGWLGVGYRGIEVKQEPKYDFQDGQVINRASGEVIPADEPVFILRGRDIHAVATLNDYWLRVGAGEHGDAVNARIVQFNEFAEQHPDRMKEPDTDTSVGDWTQ